MNRKIFSLIISIVVILLLSINAKNLRADLKNFSLLNQEFQKNTQFPKQSVKQSPKIPLSDFVIEKICSDNKNLTVFTIENFGELKWILTQIELDKYKSSPVRINTYPHEAIKWIAFSEKFLEENKPCKASHPERIYKPKSILLKFSEWEKNPKSECVITLENAGLINAYRNEYTIDFNVVANLKNIADCRARLRYVISIKLGKFEYIKSPVELNAEKERTFNLRAKLMPHFYHASLVIIDETTWNELFSGTLHFFKSLLNEIKRPKLCIFQKPNIYSDEKRKVTFES